MVGGRQNPAEIARWFAALPNLAQPEQYLDGLTRGLRLTGVRNLQVPGADQTFARLLSSSSEAVQIVPLLRASRTDPPGAAGRPFARSAAGQPRSRGPGAAGRAFRRRSASA
jgi:hypothetical protein